jgi:serine/threonine-protein kinase
MTDLAAHEERLARFERAWQTRPPAVLAEFLPGKPDERRAFLLDAIPVDLEYRWCRFWAGGDFLKASEVLPSRPLIDDYRRRFPDLGALAQLPAELIAEEYRVRCWAGERPTHADYFRRFPAQAARLGPLVKEIDEDQRSRPEAPPQDTGEWSGETPAELPDSALAALLRQLQSLPFLTPAQLKELPALAGQAGNDSVTLARHLVERGWLTALQADFLLRGRGARLVVGSYLLLERIGSGWSSQVFRARHTGLNRIVALKLFRRELLQGVDEEVLRRFYQEMQAVGRLSHPNVVHAFDAGPVGQTLIIAMEYLEGIDLQRLVEQCGPLGVDEATAYIHQAALGLQHVVEHGLVHRDIKPSNLMIVNCGLTPAELATRNPQSALLKVLDLGMARIQQAVQGGSGSALTRTGWLMGTADFMAPEQGVDPHAVDIRADLYSLGCTYFYLLTGRPPFPGGSFLHKLSQHRDTAAPSIAVLRRDIPAPIAAVVERLLRKRPEERFRSPGELAAALVEARRGIGLRSATSVSPAFRRVLWLAGGMAAALILAILVFAGWFIMASRQQNQAVAGGHTPVAIPSDAPSSPFSKFEGIWRISYTNRAIRIYLIDSGGRVFFGEGGLHEGQLRSKGDEILLDFPRDTLRLERLRIVDGELLIDHFNPASGYPDRPLCTGVGKRQQSLAGIKPTRSGWEGIWVVKFANGVERAYGIDERGNVWVADGGELRHAQVAARSNQVVVSFGDKHLERLRLQGGSLAVQRFDQPADYPGNVAVTGTGAKR